MTPNQELARWVRDFRGFDPDEPRDEQGRWTDGGGSGDTASSTTPSHDDSWTAHSKDRKNWKEAKDIPGSGTAYRVPFGAAGDHIVFHYNPHRIDGPKWSWYFDRWGGPKNTELKDPVLQRMREDEASGREHNTPEQAWDEAKAVYDQTRAVLAKPIGGKKGKFELTDFAKDHVDIDAGTEKDKFKSERLVEQWNEYVGIPPGEFRTKFLGGLPGTLGVGLGSQDEIYLIGTLTDKNGEKIGEYARMMDFKHHNAEAIGLELNADQTGHGVGKQMLQANVQMFRDLDLDAVKVHANIDVGGYAWAKYGYVPNQGSWEALRSKLRAEAEEDDKVNADPRGKQALFKLLDSKNPKALWGVADSKFGKDLLLGIGWFGELNFSDQQSMDRFNAYIGRKR